jgi:hypothetical protein
MNAVVEVATAGVAAEAKTVTAVAVRVFSFTRNALSQAVATFTMRVPSINGCSLSAVAPDLNLRKELALAGV